ncbi:IclR family transcriptional regulator [Priestia abyssalis]|uniref:IclR family transcriptional regulator n=1 Tax=Priestia abyssalis TaxID=1221450 RepID=UPI0014743DAD|nr:IclR family transcriptional regulator [Priestia abyssalis]
MSQSFKRGVMILDLFSAERPVLTLDEIAAEVQISPITAYRYVKVLSEAGILILDERRVYLSAKILRFVNLFWQQDHLAALAKESISILAHELNETIALCKLEANDVVCIYAVESSLTLRTTFSIGERMPIYSGAFSRTIAAFLPERELKSIIQHTKWIPHTESTIVDSHEFHLRLDRIRQDGYDISNGEVESGVVALAVPILVSGQIKGSLGLAIPSVRYSPDETTSIIGRMQEVSQHISKELEKHELLNK